ncbi:type IA DNA topoisomerase [Anaerobacillus sp. 1_MG-2023]|uniref:type IA DNA topoisomerase n=1 Tax=Anaerobacillus sp. 1_MG-2023 TaxID=3062655 RepID=UPI0026E4337A|nr:type IA DNA topoisomerase [Anaerobacillus sp. 1_MG-2023]MDO6657471.1 DNA topoisomerase [Anaerobacillus sp. 1_MG-2023]
MGKSLIIAEKNSQAKKYSEAFNGVDRGTHLEIPKCSTFPSGAIVVHAIGHIMELYSFEDYNAEDKEWDLHRLPIIPDQFKLKVTPSKRKAFNNIKKYLNDPQVSDIIHAGDAGREGSLLVTEVLLYLNNKKPVKRLWTSSLTKESLQKAFKNLRSIEQDMPLYYEALARQRADFLIGMNMSRCMTLLLSNKKGVKESLKDTSFSCGRVQSPLLGLIFTREQAIEDHKSKPYWDLEANITYHQNEIRSKWYTLERDHLFKKNLAEDLKEYCEGKEAKVHSVKSEVKRIRPPQLYNLTTIQVEINKKLGLSPDGALKILQGLYDKSLVSYPRSSPVHVNPSEAVLFPEILNNLSTLPEYKSFLKLPYKDISEDKRFIDESKTDDHYAIIPTEKIVDFTRLSKNEVIVYDMIAKSLIAAHYPDAIETHSEIISVVDEKFSFMTKGKRVEDRGWREVYEIDKLDEDSTVVLPTIEEGAVGTVIEIQLKEGKTSPPARYTLGSLVTLMANAANSLTKEERKGFKSDELSLGTVATRASIITKIIERKYIRIEKNKVYIEPKGRMLIESLGVDSYLTSVLTTGNMEQYLSGIGAGKSDFSIFMNRMKQITLEEVKKAKESADNWELDNHIEASKESVEVGTCLECGSAVIDAGKFYGCSSFKDTNCRFKVNKMVNNKELTNHQVKVLLQKGVTPLIKGFKKRNKEGTFDAFLAWSAEQKRMIFQFPERKK